LQAGRRIEARTLLQRALDLDTLRFRSDSSLNAIVREFRSVSSSSVEVVDLASSLATRSEGGVPGDDLVYEHVHLTLRGTYDAARELFLQISSDLARRRFIATEIPEPFSYDEARIRLAYTAHEQAMIALELLNRFRSPPFTGQADHSYRLQSWQRRAETATTLLARPDALPALRELYARAIQAAPDDWILTRNAGAMFVARGAPIEALPLLERTLAWIDDDVDTLVALGWAQRALGQTAESAQTFAQVRALEPNYPGLP
jgi:tetratricopeptide (TPR) repeat protein